MDGQHSAYCDRTLEVTLGSQKFVFEQLEANYSQKLPSVVVENKTDIKVGGALKDAEVVSAAELAQRIQRLSYNNVRPVVSGGRLYLVPEGEDVDVRTAVPSNSRASLLSENTAISSAENIGSLQTTLKLLKYLKKFLGNENYQKFLDFSKESLAMEGDENCESVLTQELSALLNGVLSFGEATEQALQMHNATEVTARDAMTGESHTAAEVPSIVGLNTARETLSDPHTARETPADLQTAREALGDLGTAREAPSALNTALETPSALNTARVTPSALNTARETPSALNTVREAYDDLRTAREAYDDLRTAYETADDLRTAIEVPSGDGGLMTAVENHVDEEDDADEDDDEKGLVLMKVDTGELSPQGCRDDGYCLIT